MAMDVSKICDSGWHHDEYILHIILLDSRVGFVLTARIPGGMPGEIKKPSRQRFQRKVSVINLRISYPSGFRQIGLGSGDITSVGPTPAALGILTLLVLDPTVTGC